MKRNRGLLELSLVMLLVASAAWWVSQRPGQPSLQERQQGWKQHFSQSFEAIRQEDYARAERHLEQARALAVDFPANDRSLAETYDDMGLLYYKTQRLEQCRQAQVSAITALLLAGGPEDPELELYLDRFGYVAGDISDLKEVPARIFKLGVYPVSGPRLEVEGKLLFDAYQARGDSESARLVEVYLHSAPTS
ncbi:MAG: hypothetical protein AB7S38_07215 [Vulcanimicrobiota bacterium]